MDGKRVEETVGSMVEKWVVMRAGSTAELLAGKRVEMRVEGKADLRVVLKAELLAGKWVEKTVVK